MPGNALSGDVRSGVGWQAMLDICVSSGLDVCRNWLGECGPLIELLVPAPTLLKNKDGLCHSCRLNVNKKGDDLSRRPIIYGGE